MKTFLGKKRSTEEILVAKRFQEKTLRKKRKKRKKAHSQRMKAYWQI